MENVVIDRSGKIAEGYFYELDVLADDDAEWKRSGTPQLDIVSLRPPLVRKSGKQGASSYLSVSVNKVTGRVSEFGCSLDKRHETFGYWQDLSLTLFFGPESSDLIFGDMEGSRTQFVTEIMAKRLRATPFTGYRLHELKDIDYSNVVNLGLSAQTCRLFELQFQGKSCRRGFSIVGAPNACPHCGKSPLVCPECGFYDNICPDCGKSQWVAEKNKKGPDDKRLITAGWAQWSPMMVDIKRWDGSDFVFITTDAGFQTNVVTKRVVDWLQSIHAAPFIARPVHARLDGASLDQLRQLESAKQGLR